MNRDIMNNNDFYSSKINPNIGEQPRKLMARKDKKHKFFDSDFDDIEMDKHRQTYKRVAAKYSTRIQLHSNEVIF